MSARERFFSLVLSVALLVQALPASTLAEEPRVLMPSASEIAGMISLSGTDEKPPDTSAE